MRRHGEAYRNKKGNVEKKLRITKKENGESSLNSRKRESADISLRDTPFDPQMTEHAEILSRIPFSVQREEFILRLHETYGSSYVQRLMKTMNVQAKLTVSNPNDIYEQEADRVADAVTKSINTPVQRQTPEEDEELTQGKLIQRQSTSEEEEELLQGKFDDIQKQVPEEEELLQSKVDARRQTLEEEELQMETGENPTKAVADNIETRINGARGGGQPLSDEVRNPMEQALGADFNGVRTHTDLEADKLNKELSAKAFTTGKDIFFRDNEYSPGSDSGKKLIAHELTHVVQQNTDILQQPAGQDRPVQLRDDQENERKEIRRKIGFEAELSVPSLDAPDPFDRDLFEAGPGGESATAAIQQFLFGGLEYGTELGKNANFTLEPDHNILRRKGKAIERKLIQMGYLKASAVNSTSNLEYVTPALDELAANSTTAFNTQFNAIKNHVNSLFPDVTNQIVQIPAPAGTYYTGIPVADFQRWLGDDYAQLEPFITDFQNYVQNKFYLQATAGVIPSSLRELHQAHTPAAGQVRRWWEAAMREVDAKIDQLLTQDWFINDDFVKDLRKKPGWFKRKTRRVDYAAFKGLLHLTYMYMVGSALNQTNVFGSTLKNAVPFLVKLSNLGDIVNRTTTEYLRNNKPSASLRNQIDAFFKATPEVSVETWTSKEGIEAGAGPQRVPIVGDDFVEKMLTGGNVPTLTGSPIQNPDVLPEKVSEASAGQQGVPVEYRYITSRPNADGLAAVLLNVIREIRTLNTKHLSDKKRRTIIDNANK